MVRGSEKKRSNCASSLAKRVMDFRRGKGFENCLGLGAREVGVGCEGLRSA